MNKDFHDYIIYIFIHHTYGSTKKNKKNKQIYNKSSTLQSSTLQRLLELNRKLSNH